MLVCHIYKLYVTAAWELQEHIHMKTMGKERKRKQREVKDGKAKKRMKRIRTTESQQAVARTLVLEGYSQSEAASRTRMSQASVSNA